jgi:hypothetical protein
LEGLGGKFEISNLIFEIVPRMITIRVEEYQIQEKRQ